jgi:hypothetical protein
MEVSFAAPKRWKTRLVDGEGKAFAATPKLFTTKQGLEIYQTFEANVKGMAQQFLVGVTWGARFRDYYKQVSRYLVNDKVEYRLTMNPKTKGMASTVILKIASGLPREIVQVDDKGARYIARFRYQKRDDLDGLNLLIGTKHEKDNVQLLEESYDYLTRKGLILLNKVTRLVSEGEMREQVFTFDALEVNPEFAPDWFERDERPKASDGDGEEPPKKDPGTAGAEER